MTASLTDRQRPHQEPHVRAPELQILDALLRIEELLVNLNEALAGPRSVTDRGNYEDRVTPEPEPEPEPTKPAPKRRPRSL